MNENLFFKSDELSELWKQFVLVPSCIEEKNLFFTYLIRYREDPKSKYFLYRAQN